MTQGSWLALLDRQMGRGGPISFDDIVVGHDFGLLGCGEIQGWLRAQGFEGPLWAACGEVTGKVPRPGGQRWARSQDRWRVALLKDILQAPLSMEALAVAVESIYERVGCPEDMLGLWKRPSPWEKKTGVANPEAILDFLKQKDGGGVPA